MVFIEVKRGSLHKAELQQNFTDDSLSAPGLNTYTTPHDSTSCWICFKDTSSISVALRLFYWTANDTHKTRNAFKKGHPSFLIYLSLHLNMSLFAVFTLCLHTSTGRTEQIVSMTSPSFGKNVRKRKHYHSDIKERIKQMSLVPGCLHQLITIKENNCREANILLKHIEPHRVAKGTR